MEITLNVMSLEWNVTWKWNVTSKWYVTQNGMLLEMEFLSKWNVTKMECLLNKNFTTFGKSL